MPKKRATFFSLRYENIQQQFLNVANYMMQIKYIICKMHHFSFSTQPNKQGSELHCNAARSLIYTDD